MFNIDLTGLAFMALVGVGAILGVIAAGAAWLFGAGTGVLMALIGIPMLVGACLGVIAERQ